MATRSNFATTGRTLMEVDPWNGREPQPSEWPVPVTGAGGFVGGHVARAGARDMRYAAYCVVLRKSRTLILRSSG